MMRNDFLARLRAGAPQTGLWQNLPGAAAAEIAAAAGFEWVLLDQEHAPRSLDALVAGQTAARLHGAHPIVRTAGHDPHEIGRMLDAGFQTVLVPMVETGEQAAALARACDFAPAGVRGVSSQTRAGSWGTDTAYLREARTEICLIAQIESVDGARDAERIFTTPGIDAVFIGAADLAATMGHLGQPGHPDVTRTIADLIALAHHHGMPLGTLVKGAEAGQSSFDAGFRFVGVGTDTAILAHAQRALRAQFPHIMRKADHD